MGKKFYDVQDVLNAGYNLEPLKCRYCGSFEVSFNQYQSDAQCAECGQYQLEPELTWTCEYCGTTQTDYIDVELGPTAEWTCELCEKPNSIDYSAFKNQFNKNL